MTSRENDLLGLDMINFISETNFHMLELFSHTFHMMDSGCAFSQRFTCQIRCPKINILIHILNVVYIRM